MKRDICTMMSFATEYLYLQKNEHQHQSGMRYRKERIRKTCAPQNGVEPVNASCAEVNS
jgi:hypothetical protein